jgi:hypothetical protein
MGFDIEGAKKAGFTDEQIFSELATSTKYDVESARKAGYKDTDIMAEMARGKPITDQPKSIGDFVLNKLPESASNVAKGLYNVVRHPIDTATGMRDFVAGAGAEVRKGLGLEENPYLTDEDRKKAEATFAPTKEMIEKSIKEPAGIPGRVADYLYEKPVEAGLWASGGLGIAAKGAEVAGLGRVGAGLRTASEVINPITEAARGIEKAAPIAKKVGGRVFKEVEGVYTGKGKGAIEEAIAGSPAFKNALRGNVTGEEVVEHARDALQTIKDKRSADYQGKLQEISQNQQPIDLTPIIDEFMAQMDRYGVKVSKDAQTGKLNVDMSRVSIGDKAKPLLREVIKRIGTYGDQAGDTTAIGLDKLHRYISDSYMETSQARGFVASMDKAVKDTITRAVPEYGEMTKGYAEASNFIKDVESVLSLRKQGISGRMTADNVLRKLTSAMRENFEMRRDILDTLGREAGQNLSGEVAGYAMNQWVPGGLMGKLSLSAAAYSGYTHYLNLMNPKMWPILAASSPKIMGEFLMAYGKAAERTEIVRDVAAQVAKQIAQPGMVNPAFIAGQASGRRKEFGEQ